MSEDHAKRQARRLYFAREHLAEAWSMAQLGVFSQENHGSRTDLFRPTFSHGSGTRDVVETPFSAPVSPDLQCVRDFGFFVLLCVLRYTLISDNGGRQWPEDDRCPLGYDCHILCLHESAILLQRSIHETAPNRRRHSPTLMGNTLPSR